MAYPTKDKTINDSASWIEMRYNHVRLHSALEYRAPNEAERESPGPDQDGLKHKTNGVRKTPTRRGGRSQSSNTTPSHDPHDAGMTHMMQVRIGTSWYPHWDSNPGPCAYQARTRYKLAALTAELWGPARAGRFAHPLQRPHPTARHAVPHPEHPGQAAHRSSYAVDESPAEAFPSFQECP